MNKRLVILSDYGLDDAVALAHILKFKAQFSAIDIVAVAGNVDEKTSFLNACKLLSCEEGLENIRIVKTDNIKQLSSVLPQVHGGDGMGDLLSEVKDGLPVVSFTDFLNDVDENSILFSVGPQTVTLEILKAKKTGGLVIMAGMVAAEPNFNGMEFNQALDVAAYNETLKYPHVVATLDSCRAKAFNLAGFRFSGYNLLNKLINRSIELAEKRHPDNCYIYDFIASLYLVRPEIFDVEILADSWGNTLFQLKVKKGFNLKEYIENL